MGCHLDGQMARLWEKLLVVRKTGFCWSGMDFHTLFGHAHLIRMTVQSSGFP